VIETGVLRVNYEEPQTREDGSLLECTGSRLDGDCVALHFEHLLEQTGYGKARLFGGYKQTFDGDRQKV